MSQTTSNMPSNLSSPSLIKLFQKTRNNHNNASGQTTTSIIQNSDEFSSETTNSTSNNSNQNSSQPKQKVKQKKHESNQKRQQQQQQQQRSRSRQGEDQSNNVKTTSFSQLRQRSLSSCTIGTSDQRCIFEFYYSLGSKIRTNQRKIERLNLSLNYA